MRRNKKDEGNPKVQAAISKSVNYEVSIADLAKRSERRAWMVASGALLMSLMLAGGYFYMLPLKEKVPYLVMADAYSGTATVARLTGNFGDTGITASEALNRSNVSHFVTARESYDVALMRMGDWKTVYTMATPPVASGYTQLHARNNPNSPYAQFGSNRAIRVRILSIVFQGAKGSTPTGATVRFQRSLYDKATGNSKFMDNKLATMTFEYEPNLKMSETDRVANPLGFRVTGYRVDSDFAETPGMTADTGLLDAAADLQAQTAPAAPATASDEAAIPATPEMPQELAHPDAAFPADALGQALPPGTSVQQVPATVPAQQRPAYPASQQATPGSRPTQAPAAPQR